MFGLLEEALAYREDEDKCADAESDDRPVVCQLQSGDFHVCSRHSCPYATVDADSRAYMCSLSGLTWGSTMLADIDPSWTGRSTSSGDPDAVAGTPVGGWKARKDCVAESAKAFEVAKQIVSCEVQCFESEEAREARLARLPAKRGARCVAYDDRDDCEERRPKVQRKLLNGQAAAEKLRIECGAVLDKLTRPVSETITSKASLQKTDPRLSSFEFVSSVALRKWAKRCALGEERCDMSRYHDVLVSAHWFVKEKREQIARENMLCSLTGKKRRCAFDGPLKYQLGALAVALWRAAACSPYLTTSKRAGDSFRPFISGLCYSLKRGLRCPFIENKEIIPTFPRLAESLPTLRSADSSKGARQLQSQSHRGISCLHRSISSLEDLEALDPESEVVREARREFVVAARICAQFRAFVESRLRDE